MINIVLFEPEIPQNTGNIMRTCAGTGVKLHLIRPLGFSLNDKILRRNGVNYIEHCDYKIYDDFEDIVKQNQGTYYFLTRYGKKIYADCDFSNQNEKIYLIFGKESTGIPKEILKENIDKCLRIPINNQIRALNVANSVAIVFYEVLRQQNFPNLLFTDPFKGEKYLEN